MKKNKILVAALSATLLTQAIIPAVQTKDYNKGYALTSVVYAAEDDSSKETANQKLDYLGDLIQGIEDIVGGLTGNQLDWLKSLKDAYNFLSKILNNGLVDIKELREKFIPRLDLLINVAEAITADATELADSEQQAHIIIGFSVPHALVKATDLFESADGLNKASENLQQSLEKARQVPKLTDNSKRTHYTLEKLDRAIANAKSVRNKELRYKLDPNKLAEVDMMIKQAVEVRRNTQATVGEVKEVTDKLNATIEEAYLSIDEGDRLASGQSKLTLEKDIQVAKNLRDFKLKGKVESQVIKELNRAIANANRVLKNSKTTQNQMISADEDILLAIKKAEAVLEAKDIEENVEENIEEAADEKVLDEATDELDSEEDSTDKEEKLEDITKDSPEEISEEEVEEDASEDILESNLE